MNKEILNKMNIDIDDKDVVNSYIDKNTKALHKYFMQNVDHDMLIETVRVRGVFWYDIDNDINDFVSYEIDCFGQYLPGTLRFHERGEYGEMSAKRYLGKREENL